MRYTAMIQFYLPPTHGSYTWATAGIFSQVKHLFPEKQLTTFLVVELKTQVLTVNANKLTQNKTRDQRPTIRHTRYEIAQGAKVRNVQKTACKVNIGLMGAKVTRSSAIAKSTARPSCLVGVLHDIYRETNNRSTAN